MKVLRSTYADSKLHDKWRRVYRSDPRQLALDEVLYDWLFRRLQPQGAWLDAGCGSGERTFMLARRAGSVLAIDLSPSVLQVAATNAAALQIERRVQFEQGGLEELNGESVPRFRRHNVHCRGVLMHIPEWHAALVNLCRCAESGGYVVVLENNSRSLETVIVRLSRWIVRPRSRMVATDGGLEFRAESDGKYFVVRMANLRAIEEVMRAENVAPLLRRAISLFDTDRFPGLLRRLVINLNWLWFRGNLPLASGVMIVGRKA
jgi:ubiquinone/menaquinone biosynthesis C-methylase UbiE